jgi:Flp pilus assembly protein TadG
MLFHRFRRSDQGAAAVEFAVVAPLLLLFIFAIIDFGRFLATHNRLVSAVREGARAAAATVPVSPATRADSIQARARRKVINYLNNAGVRQPNGNPVADAQVIVTQPGADGLITVQLNVNGSGGFPYTPIALPFANRIGLNGIVLRPIAVFRYELAD